MQFPSPTPFPPFPTPKGPQATFLTGLLFGLIFGGGASLVEILYAFLFWNGAITSWLLTTGIIPYLSVAPFFLGDMFMPVLALILFILCPIAGLWAARRTQRTLSGTWAGLSAATCIVLVDVIILWLSGEFRAYSIGFFILTHLLTLAMGTYLGFLGGLIGRKKKSVKNIIGVFYCISMVIFGTSLLVVLYDWADFYYWANYGTSSLYAGNFYSMPLLWGIALVQPVASICGLIATILTLIEFYRVRAWTQFILTFFFSGILTLIYLITGAQPAPAPVPQNAPLVAASLPPSSLPVALAATPAQPSALDILQQRLAKGEIDEATYQRLAVVLEKQR